MASESESERRETSADIADEIRRAVESMGNEMPYTVSAGTMRKVADRIEAAAKRVVVSKKETTTIGNAATLREAAETVYNVLEKLKTFSLHIGDIGHKRELNHLVCLAKNRLDAALSAPARQCDVGTAEEQGERCMAQFDQWRRKGDGKKLITAIMDWAQMPYAEEGGAA